MALTDSYLDSAELHPIDLVEDMAAHLDWSFERVAEDQIALTVTGQWREYAITLAWSERDEMLRLIASYEMSPPGDRRAALYEALNLANDQIWEGSFTFWGDQDLIVWRYGLMLSGGQIAAPEQIERMLNAAVVECERFYPAFQLACWGQSSPAEAMGVALSDCYGRA